MEEKEAIARLRDHFLIHDDGRPTPKLNEAVSIVIKATEKQIAKKPKHLPLKEGITTTNYECPICGCRRLGHGIGLDKCYCPECGQKLDWTVLEGEEVDE